MIKKIDILENSIEITEEKKGIFGIKEYTSKIEKSSINTIERITKNNELIGVIIWDNKGSILYAIGVKNYEGDLEEIYNKILNDIEIYNEILNEIGQESKNKKEAIKCRKGKSYKIIGLAFIIMGILIFIIDISEFVNWNAKKDNYTLEYVYSESGTLYYEIDNEKIYIENIYNTSSEKITLNIPNGETIIMYIDKTNINDGIYFDLDDTDDRNMLNPIASIFVALFFITGGLFCILKYEEVNGKEHKVTAVVPVFIFLIIVGIGLISTQVYNPIKSFKLKGETVATIYSEMYNKGGTSNLYKPVAYYFVDGKKYVYVNNFYENGILSDNLGSTFEIYYDEQNPSNAIKKDNSIDILVLVVGIVLIVMGSCGFVGFIRSKDEEAEKQSVEIKNSYL